MNTSLALLFCAALVLSGCDASDAGDASAFGQLPDDRVALVTGAGSAKPGERVALRLSNGTDVAVGYNLCSNLELDRRVGEEWERVEASLAPPPGVCQNILRALDPGGSAQASAHLPRGLAQGTYRLATMVEVGIGSESERVETQPFEVQR